MRSTPSFSRKNHPESRIKSLSLISEKTPRTLNMPPFWQKSKHPIIQIHQLFWKRLHEFHIYRSSTGRGKREQGDKNAKNHASKAARFASKTAGFLAPFFLCPPIWDKRNYQCTKRAMQKLVWKRRKTLKLPVAPANFQNSRWVFILGRAQTPAEKCAFPWSSGNDYTLSLPLPP